MVKAGIALPTTVHKSNTRNAPDISTAPSPSRRKRRSAAAPARTVPVRRALTGSGLVVVGLALTSVGGVAAGGWTGVRLWVVLQPLVGAALAGFGPLARRSA